MNYTYQVYMKNGVTKELVEAQIHRLQEKAMREMADNEEIGYHRNHCG